MSLRSPPTRRTLRSYASGGPTKIPSTSTTSEDKPKISDDFAEVPMTTYKRQRPANVMGGVNLNTSLFGSPGFTQTPDSKSSYNLTTPGFGIGMSPIPLPSAPQTPAGTTDITIDSIMSPLKTPGVVTSNAAYSDPTEIVDYHVTLFGIPESMQTTAIAQVACGAKVSHIERSEGNYIVLALTSTSAVKLALTHHGALLRSDDTLGNSTGTGVYILGVRRTRRSDLSPAYLASLPARSTVPGSASATPAATPAKTPVRRNNNNSNALMDVDAEGMYAAAPVQLRSPFDISRKRKLINAAALAEEEKPLRKRKSVCSTLFGW